MKKLGLIANCSKSRAREVLHSIERMARRLGLKLYADEATAGLMNKVNCLPHRKLLDTVDAVVALGGDGTMLRVVRTMAGKDKPVIGFNIGSLGFLTSVAEKEIDRALKSLAKNDFFVSVRTIVEATVLRKDRVIGRYRALNDVVLDTGPSARVVSLDVSIDGDSVTSFVCDGLILSTPTGSTGHSLSAGGPIVLPASKVLVMSTICPHTLSTRPLVIPDHSEIVVTAAETDGEFFLSVDGQVGQPLKEGDSIKVRVSHRNVRFIHLPGHSYFSVLRHKLHWRGSSL